MGTTKEEIREKVKSNENRSEILSAHIQEEWRRGRILFRVTMLKTKPLGLESSG